MKRNHFLILAIVLSVAACNYRKMKNEGDNLPFENLDCTPVSFAKVATEVFGTGPSNPGRCLGCHNSGFDISGMGIVVDDYPQAFAARNSINNAIQSGSMPKGAPLNGALKKMVLTWVQQGAPERDEQAILDPRCPPAQANPDPVVPPVDPIDDPVIPPALTLTPDFESLNVEVFSKRCNSCHREFANRYDFTNHGRLVETSMGLFAGATPEDTTFVKSLLPGAKFPMPLKGTPLSDEQVKVIIEWIKLGMPEKPSVQPVIVE